MDCYDYMMRENQGYKYHTLVDDAPLTPRRRRQRDVSKGTPFRDISLALGHAELSTSTGESFEEWALRQLTLPPAQTGG